MFWTALEFLTFGAICFEGTLVVFLGRFRYTVRLLLKSRFGCLHGFGTRSSHFRDAPIALGCTFEPEFRIIPIEGGPEVAPIQPGVALPGVCEAIVNAS